MSNSDQDTALIQVLLERFNTQRFPRAQELKDKVDQGGLLSDMDLKFLQQVFDDAEGIKDLVDRHPELHSYATKAVEMYHHITEKALENQCKQKP